MLRNPELRRALLVGGLLASAAAMSLSGWQAACVALALGTVLLVLYGVELCCRYRAMARLAADIDAVLHGSGDIHLADYGEGEVSLLRSEVRKMTLRLREQSAQLEKEKLQLADAMADISHQMRTPLTAVNLLLTSLAGHVDEESRGDVRALRRQVARMDWLVESLLKLAKLDAGTARFCPETIPLSALLARVNLYAGQKQDALTYAVEVIRASNNGIFPFVDRSLVVGNPEDPDRIFSSEVVFALSHAKRSQLFLNYFNPARTTFTFRMESDLISKAIFGGGAETGGYQDDYRNRVNWSTSGENRYFYKYTDMAQTGKIQNTMIPMLRLGEMYLIAAESQSDVLANGTSYVNTLRRNRGISTSLEALTPELLKYEYIRELYGEGQLFYLYKRLFSKVIWSYTDSRNPEPSTNLFVVPLPDSETENRE